MKITKCKIIQGAVTPRKSGWEEEKNSEFEAAAKKIVAEGFEPMGGVAITGTSGMPRAAQTFVKCGDDNSPKCEYRVIIDNGYRDGSFEKEIQSAIDDGWKPQGGVAFTDNNVLIQAFVRKHK